MQAAAVRKLDDFFAGLGVADLEFRESHVGISNVGIGPVPTNVPTVLADATEPR
ncbi:hypothetical protein K9U39_14250 [Rhodoblastus acidophilus]|nr:hypothetical protein [Rhodoblastus acidophilus]